MRRQGINIEKCYCAILMLLMIVMLVVPVSYQKIKIGMLAFLMGGLLYSTLKNKFRVPSDILKVMLIYILYNTISIIIGIVMSAPGAVRVITTDILWPILFVMFFCAFSTMNTVNYVFRGIVLGMWIVSIMDFLVLMIAYGFLPLSMTLFTQIDLGYYVNPLGRAFTSGHMVSYLFGIPFVAGLIVVDKNGKRRLRNCVLLFFELFNIFLSGRRAMFLLIILLPFFGFIIYRYILSRGFLRYRVCSRLPRMHTVILLLAFVCIFSILYILKDQIFFLIETLLEGFEFRNVNNSDAYVRGTQFSALMKGWLEHPLFGNGAGSYTIECIRSTEHLWAYELSYCALLFQKGIIGACTFFSLVLFAYRESKKKIQQNKEFFRYSYPVLLGMTGTLIGNATNPYLGNFSCIWYLFIAVALPGMLKENGS